jgi:hypothetical protein
VANSTRGGHGARDAPAPAPSTYSDFTTTHLSLFTEAGESLEADHWLHVIESKFGLLRCTEMQKTHHCAVVAWWANYAATRHTDYQVLWTEFHSAFRAHYFPADVMGLKRQEFMDLKQGGRSVHDHSKVFNHLVQYALDQVDTFDKKQDRFLIGLSTKL